MSLLSTILFGSLLSLQHSGISSLVPKALTNGQPDVLPSPCGANCTFALAFDVPFLDCNTTTFNTVLQDTTAPDVFIATWDNYVLNVTTFALDLSGASGEDSFSQSTFPARGTTTVCTPARAKYTLDIKYENNLQTMNVSIGSSTPLNIQSPAPFTTPQGVLLNDSIIFPGFMGFGPDNSGYFYGLEALNWTQPLVSWYRDLQLMALIDEMATSMKGLVVSLPLNGPNVESTCKSC